MTEPAAQRVEFTDEERKIRGDMATDDEATRAWSKLEEAIIDLLEQFPGGRRVIADWLRDEADEVESDDKGGKYAHLRVWPGEGK